MFHKLGKRIVSEGGSMVIPLSWEEIDHNVSILAERVQCDGKPEIIIGIQRGGLIPGIILSHCLGVRDFFPFNINRTAYNGINAEKVAPRLGPNISLKIVTKKNILLVDDIVGTGATLRMVQHMLIMHAPLQIRSLVCVVNRDNWENSNSNEPSTLISYIGKEVRGWVVFPWEKDQARA
jgi:uncharacterized protein